MRVLLTGHDGYIGQVMGPVLSQAGHEVVGLDNYLYEGCTFGEDRWHPPALRSDVRDVRGEDLAGFDAVVHLAGVSNDPVGDLDPSATFAINHTASVRLARLAKEAGVGRFLFSSSCSLYGAADPESLLDEGASFNPVTAYGESKVLVERDLALLADERFSPTSLRNATVYGVSSRLRADLVVNNLTGFAHVTGEVRVASDGTPWRPLVHVEDVARAFLAVLEAPRDLVHGEAFNVGATAENYRISEVADIVAEVVPGSRVTYAAGGGPDARCYRVSFDKLASVLPAGRPRWTVRGGVEQLHAAYQRDGLTLEELTGPRFTRLGRVRELRERGVLDPALHRLDSPQAVSAEVPGAR